MVELALTEQADADLASILIYLVQEAAYQQLNAMRVSLTRCSTG